VSYSGSKPSFIYDQRVAQCLYLLLITAPTCFDHNLQVASKFIETYSLCGNLHGRDGF